MNDATIATAIDAAAAVLGDRARHDVPIGALTTYRVGGAAALFMVAESAGDLALVAEARRRSGLELLVLGRGSNMLVADRGFPGIVVTLGPGFETIDISGTSVVAGAAVRLPVLARATAAAALTGLEWAVGVPGSVGGGVRMNAGGHGSDIAASLVRVRVVNLRSGEDGDMSASAIGLEFRRSSLTDDDAVVSATFVLHSGDRSASERELAEIVKWRRENQPGGQNAGSVFVNPLPESAGAVIDRLGLRGFRVGSARVSEKHANFIQADDGGSADDVYAVMQAVRAKVSAATGITLRSEVRLVGFGERGAMTTEAPPRPPRSKEDIPLTGPDEPVHPRFWERRLAVARETGQRRFRWFVAAAVVVIVVCLAWAIAKSAWFSVEQIEVTGAHHTDPALVLEASGVANHEAMLDVNLGRARHQIRTLPWVEKVSVKRSWPRHVTIEITERHAAASIADSDRVLWLVDNSGRVLEAAREDTIGDLPRVVGPAQVPLTAGVALAGGELDAVKVAASLPVSLRAQLTQVDWDATGSVQLELSTGILVRLGSPERLVDKYVAVLTVIAGPDAAKLATIDVRSPSSPAVTLKGTGK